MIKDELLEKIRSHRAKIGVIGLGYVGLPLVLRFGEEKFSILGFDVDAEKVQKLNAGQSYIRYIPGERLQSLRNSSQFEVITDFGRLAEADAIIICVPISLIEKKDPDLQYIEKTGQSIVKTLCKGQLVSLESTTYLGTIDEILLEKFKSTGLKVGQDYFLVFSSEREDPGNAMFSTCTIPKV